MNSALQLDVENALATYLATLKIPPDTKGTYLGLVADPPDWEDGVTFATLNFSFELATGGVNDHDRAAALSADHQTRVAAIIELFSQQKYDGTKVALNAISAALQFIGWEAGKAEDGTSEDGSQLVTKLAYVFDVYLAS
jgi:hypothetical protein